MNPTVLEVISHRSVSVMTLRRAASGGIEGMGQLTTAESSNGTCQELLVEPVECMKDCLAQTVIN